MLFSEQLKSVSEDQTFILLSQSKNSQYLSGSGQKDKMANLILQFLLKNPAVLLEIKSAIDAEFKLLESEDLNKIIKDINKN